MPRPEDRYYTTKEVLDKTGISKSTLVRWEKEGYLPRPSRRAYGNKDRLWTDRHINLIEERKNKIEEPPGDATTKKPKKGEGK